MENRIKTDFKRIMVYGSVIANMLPSIAFVICNTPNDFMNDFNRYPESFETVSIVQYSRDSLSRRSTKKYTESFAIADAHISNEEMFERLAGSLIYQDSYEDSHTVQTSVAYD